MVEIRMLKDLEWKFLMVNQYSQVGIILKQRGTKIHPGVNVKRGNDDTLFATSDGVVKFARKGRKRKIVSVVNS